MAGRLNNHGHEKDALPLTCLSGLQIALLMLSIGSCCCPFRLARQSEGLVPRRCCDSKVKGSRRPRQGGKENVSRPALVGGCVFGALWQKEVRSFFFRPEASAVGPVKNKVPHSMVTLCALASGNTGARMMTVAIEHSIATRAPHRARPTEPGVPQ